MLRYFEEMSAAQIGIELGVSEVNARRIVCNALARLRQHFESMGGETHGARWSRLARLARHGRAFGRPVRATLAPPL
jgi:Sigma-70, region 4